MQIKKINNNKLKVYLNQNDLNKKNIDIDSFLSNSLESQDLFFEILDLAEEKYDFFIENNKAIIEAISLDNNIFVLTITKLKNDSVDTYNNNSKIYFFHSIEFFLDFLSIINKNKILIKDSILYEYNNSYYLILKNTDHPNNIALENIILEYSNIIHIPDILDSFLFEYGRKITLN